MSRGSSFNSSTSVCREQPKNAHRRLGRHGRRPRPAVQRGELAEEVAGEHLTDLPAPPRDLAFAGQDDEERLSEHALLDDVVARFERELVGLRREPLQVALGEALEERDRGQARRVLPNGPTRELLGQTATDPAATTKHHVGGALAHAR